MSNKVIIIFLIILFNFQIRGEYKSIKENSVVEKNLKAKKVDAFKFEDTKEVAEKINKWLEDPDLYDVIAAKLQKAYLKKGPLSPSLKKMIKSELGNEVTKKIEETNKIEEANKNLTFNKFIVPQLRKVIENNNMFNSWYLKFTVIKLLSQNGDFNDLQLLLNMLQEKCFQGNFNSKIHSESILLSDQSIDFTIEITIAYEGILKIAQKYPEQSKKIIYNELKQKNRNPRFKDYLILILGKINDERVVDDLIFMLKNNTDGEFRVHAASSLSSFNFPNVIEALKSALNDDYILYRRQSGKRPIYSVRMAALSTLQELGVLIEKEKVNLLPNK